MAPVTHGDNTFCKTARHVTKMALNKVSQTAIKKAVNAGRRGGSSSCGLKRMVDHGIQTVAEAGGLKSFLKVGLAKVKHDGVKKVAKDLLQMATKEILGAFPAGVGVALTADGSLHLMIGEPSHAGTVPQTHREEDASFRKFVKTEGE